MNKITIELQQNNKGAVSFVMDTDVDRLSYMHFLARVLEQAIPIAIESAKNGYEGFKQEVNQKPTTH